MSERTPHLSIALVFFACLFACSDDSTTHSSADTDGDAGSGSDTAQTSTSSHETTNTSGSDDDECAMIERFYQALVDSARSCVVDEHCQTLVGSCEGGLGRECHEPVNSSVSQEDLDTLSTSFVAASCQGSPSCVCDPPPPSRCDNGVCVLADYCEGHDVGDVWVADDGCSVCSCTFAGSNCRDDMCTHPCTDANLPECPRFCERALVDGQPCHAGATCGDQDGLWCDCADGGSWQCTELEFPVEGCPQVCVPGEPPQCDALLVEYSTLLLAYRGCERSEDCQILHGPCGVGLGECYEAVNLGLPQGSLNSLGELYFQGRCSDAVCSCDPAPPVLCDNNQCALGRFCGEYDLGDSWPADDTCNTCTCTLGGSVCTNTTCGDPCEGAALPECPSACPTQQADGLPCDDGAVSCGDDEGILCACTDGLWQCQQLDPPVEGCDAFCEPRQEDVCELITSDYEAFIQNSRSCDSDSNCQWLFGQCGLGLGDCYEPVNRSISQTDLGSFGAQFFQEGCDGARCGTCGQEPLIRCVDDLCQEIEYCAGRELGEVWENGCTVCTCTTDGALCDSGACPTECELIEDAYFEFVNNATSCEEDLDCQILRGHCGVGECFSYVNLSVTQEDLDELNVQYRELGCVDILCHCTLPFAIACVGGRCKAEDL